MGEKHRDKVTARPVSDDPADGVWVEIDCGVETGTFAIVTDPNLPGMPPRAPSPSNSGESPKVAITPKPLSSDPPRKRRSLDDMRRLSEEIKRKRQPGQ